MHVALHRKCQPDLVIIFTVMKRSVEHTKTSSWFVNIKLFSLLHILVVVEKRETKYENWIDCVSLTKRNKMLWGKRERESWHRPWIIFFVFRCSLTRTCSLVSFSQLRVWCKTPSWSSLQNEGHNFQLSSHRCSRCSTVVFTSSRLAAN